MSQTTTCELELDVFPRLEHGTINHLSSQGSDVPADNLNMEYFSGGAACNYEHTMDVGHTLSLVHPSQTNRTTGLRIRNVIIEDKILHLTGVIIHYTSWQLYAWLIRLRTTRPVWVFLPLVSTLLRPEPTYRPSRFTTISLTKRSHLCFWLVLEGT